MRNGEALGAKVVEIVKGYIARSLSDLGARLKALEEAVAALPAPERGEAGPAGADGKDGQDGSSVTEADLDAAVERRAAGWELAFERRASDLLQKMADRMPQPVNGKDGADGRDALQVEDFELEAKDGGRVIMVRLKCGDRIVEREVETALVLDRGVFVAEFQYRAGDCVTWGGSTWIAQRSTNAKPETDDSWRLAVKRGRDGKEGRAGKDYAPPGTVKL